MGFVYKGEPVSYLKYSGPGETLAHSLSFIPTPKRFAVFDLKHIAPVYQIHLKQNVFDVQCTIESIIHYCLFDIRTKLNFHICMRNVRQFNPVLCFSLIRVTLLYEMVYNC